MQSLLPSNPVPDRNIVRMILLEICIADLLASDMRQKQEHTKTIQVFPKKINGSPSVIDSLLNVLNDLSSVVFEVREFDFDVIEVFEVCSVTIEVRKAVRFSDQGTWIIFSS